MKPSLYLKSLGEEAAFDRLINVPFLLLALDREVATEDDLAPAVVMLTEHERYERSKGEYFDWLEIYTGIRPEQAAFRTRLHESRYDDGSEDNVDENRAYARTSFSFLESKFPGTAHSYRSWYNDITRLDRRANNDAKRQLVAHNYRVFKETAVWEELALQQMNEQKFWNRIGLAILERVEGADYIWLKSASEFLSGIDAKDPYTGAETARTRFDAVSTQLPILSAAIALELKKHVSAHRLLSIGPETVIELKGMKDAIVLDTPEYLSLDMATRIHASRNPADRLVTLPLGPNHFGLERWRELMAGPLFIKNKAKLIPSEEFWGIPYPALKPAEVPNSLQKRMKELSVENQHIWAQLEDSGKPGVYGITIVNQTKGKGGYFTNATLTLTIEGGEIKAASYSVKGDYPIKMALDEKKILSLKARAARSNEKAQRKETGGYGKPLGKALDEAVEEMDSIEDDPADDEADADVAGNPGALQKKARNPRSIDDASRRSLPVIINTSTLPK